MTDFISWIEVRGELFYLTDFEIFSERGRDLLRGSKDNDFLGHGAIRDFYELDSAGKNKELLFFWETSRLPSELAEKVDQFEQYWGRTFRKYFMKDDLHMIIRHAPLVWKYKAAQQIMRGPLSYADEVAILRNIPCLALELEL